MEDFNTACDEVEQTERKSSDARVALLALGAPTGIELWKELAFECRECNTKVPESFATITSDPQPCPSCEETKGYDRCDADTGGLNAYWYWHCQPGCLPDSDHFGPFVTEIAALLAMAED